jgi:hypothetical protein
MAVLTIFIAVFVCCDIPKAVTIVTRYRSNASHFLPHLYTPCIYKVCTGCVYFICDDVTYDLHDQNSDF